MKALKAGEQPPRGNPFAPPEEEKKEEEPQESNPLPPGGVQPLPTVQPQANPQPINIMGGEQPYTPV